MRTFWQNFTPDWPPRKSMRRRLEVYGGKSRSSRRKSRKCCASCDNFLCRSPTTVNEKECSLVEAISTVVKYYSSTTTTSVEIPEEKPVLGQGKSVLDSSTEAVKINQPKRQDGNGRLRFTMFLGSVRENRNADRVKKFLLHTLEKLNISVTVFGVVPQRI